MLVIVNCRPGLGQTIADDLLLGSPLPYKYAYTPTIARQSDPRPDLGGNAPTNRLSPRCLQQTIVQQLSVEVRILG
jgi:hypothetical protein